MYDIDRLNLLLIDRGFEPVAVGTKLHPVLDMLDDVRGIDTTGGLQYGILSTVKNLPVNGVGSRISLHEQATPPHLIKSNGCNCGGNCCC